MAVASVRDRSFVSRKCCPDVNYRQVRDKTARSSPRINQVALGLPVFSLIFLLLMIPTTSLLSSPFFLVCIFVFQVIITFRGRISMRETVDS